MNTTPPACVTPVLFLVYARPAVTLSVLERLRQVRPAHLLVAADGPNPRRPGDAALCAQVREIIAQGVDWPCQVQTRFLEQNAGCKHAVAGALDWAFAMHERLIIVEDDCLPDVSFFRFCDELLERYSGDEKIMQICGANLTGQAAADGADYYASRMGTIWGWASWRRAWRHYDVAMAVWPDLRGSTAWRRTCPIPGEARWRTTMYDQVAAGTLDTWDVQWEFAKHLHAGLSLIPSVNLVSNLGWGADATHTLEPDDPRAAMTAGSLSFPLRHPQDLMPHDAADLAYFQRWFAPRPLLARVVNKLKRMLAS